MPKKSDIPAVTIGRRCAICGKHYILPHPKDYTKPFCDECMQILKEIVNERRQSNERSGQGVLEGEGTLVGDKGE